MVVMHNPPPGLGLDQPNDPNAISMPCDADWRDGGTDVVKSIETEEVWGKHANHPLVSYSVPWA